MVCVTPIGVRVSRTMLSASLKLFIANLKKEGHVVKAEEESLVKTHKLSYTAVPGRLTPVTRTSEHVTCEGIPSEAEGCLVESVTPRTPFF